MTILPKKKTGKEKSTPDQAAHDSSSHHHPPTHHAIPEGRGRLETPAARNIAHTSTNLEERHRSSRTRLSTDFSNSAETSSSSSSHCSNYDNTESKASCLSGENSSTHSRNKPPSPEVLELTTKSGNKPQSACDPVSSVPEVQPLVAKRRHGRLSPHSQPYARNKATRSSANTTDNSASCSTASSSSYHHNAVRGRHHGSWDERKPASPPLSFAAGNPRNSRRRQRPRTDGKEEKGGENNSDDEYDVSRLQRLNKGIDYDELEIKFQRALKEVRGFMVKEMVEDGACLFRAVAEQVYGDQNMHDEVRRHCMDYMTKNSDFFSSYVTEDFVAYIGRKRLPHTYGNHLEMQAMAEMYNRSFEVYQYSTEPINTFQSSNITDNVPIRVSYHKNSHYNAVIDPHKASVGVGLGLPSFRPGLADRMLLEDAQRASEEALLEEKMLQDKLQAADWENTEEEMLREVAQESVVEYLRHQEQLAHSSKDGLGDPNASSKQPTCSQTLPVPAESPELAASAKESSSNPIDTTSYENPASTSQGAYATAGLGNPSLGDWVDEDDESTILAQVLAQSQREYYDSLTRSNNQDEFASSSATCSKYASYK